jgi:membrane fusion protein (multidrug efflux system)
MADGKDAEAKQSEDQGAAAHPDDKQQPEEQPKKPSPLKKPWVRVLIAVVVVVILIVGGIWFYHWWNHGRFVQATNDAYLQADQVDISTKVAGTVEKVLVGDNDEVTAGQLLVQLDSNTADAELAQARAAEAQGRAQIADHEAQIHEQQAAIVQASAQVAAAEVQRAYASSEVVRYEPLAASGAETREKLTNLIANRDQAAAQLRQAQAALLQARLKVESLRAEIGIANAQIAQAAAQAREAEINVQSARITSSIDGRVGDRTVRVGEQAQVGTRFMTVVPLQAVYVVANFKETQVGLMRIGQPARITVDALKSDPLDGEVDSFAPGSGAQFALIPPSNATGNFTKIVQRIPVRIRLHAGPEARRVLVPGMSAEVSVDTVGSRDALARDEREAKDDRRQRQEEHDAEVRRDRQQERARGAQGPGSE